MNGPALFAYEVVAVDGSITKGVVEAHSRDQAVEVLRSRGGIPASVSRARTLRLGARPSSTALAEGLTSLGHLLGAGVPIAKALDVLQGAASPRWVEALPSIRIQVERGETLSAALAASSIRVPSHILGLIAAGEAAGGLTDAIERAGELAEGEHRIRSAVREALAYPLILLVAGGASTALLATVVLPAFARLLEDAGNDLPLTTAVVLSISELIVLSWQWVLACGFIMIVCWVAWVRTEAGRIRWHGLLLAAPGVGRVRRSLATARFCTALGGLLASRLPLREALTHAGGASGDAAMRQAVDAVGQRVEEGGRIAAALAEHEAFSSTAVRLIGIGEETGRLISLLSHAGHLESEQGMRALMRATRFIEPTLILAFGVVVAVVAAALLQAMYSFGPTL